MATVHACHSGLLVSFLILFVILLRTLGNSCSRTSLMVHLFEYYIHSFFSLLIISFQLDFGVFPRGVKWLPSASASARRPTPEGVRWHSGTRLNLICGQGRRDGAEINMSRDR